MKNSRLRLLALMVPCALVSQFAIAQTTVPDTPAAETGPGPGLDLTGPGPSASPGLSSASPTSVGGYSPAMQINPEGGIRAGPFTISPAVKVTMGRDDNVRLSNSNKISSDFYSLSPAAVVALPGPAQRYSASYFGNYGRYASSSNDNYDDHAVGLDANNEWSARLRTLLRYDFRRGHDAVGATASATAANAPERWDTNALRGSLAYGAKGAQGNIEVDARLLSKRYQTNTVVTSAFDYDQKDLGGAFYYRVGPKTQALVQIKGSDIEYKTNTALDNTETRYYGGLRWEATAKTQGEVKLGYLQKDYSSSSKPDFSGASYAANVTWSPLTYSVVSFNAVRTTGETTGIGNFILTDYVSLLWNHDWSSRVRSTIFLARARDDYEGAGRSDTREDIGFKLSYAFRRWLRVGGEFSYQSRDSNVPSVDYKRNLLLLTLEATL